MINVGSGGTQWLNIVRAEVHIASSDCESIRAVIGQPANVLSSLAMSAFGVSLVYLARRWGDPVRRRSLVLLGVTLISTGLGSVAFHGPGGALSFVFHDVTITALPLAAALALRSERHAIDPVRWFLAIMTAVVAARWAIPSLYYPLTVAAFVFFGWSALQGRADHDYQWPWLIASAATLAAARLAFGLSRTGAVLCQPDSWFQGHALWHVLIGIGVVFAARGLSMLPALGTTD